MPVIFAMDVVLADLLSLVLAFLKTIVFYLAITSFHTKAAQAAESVDNAFP